MPPLRSWRFESHTLGLECSNWQRSVLVFELVACSTDVRSHRRGDRDHRLRPDGPVLSASVFGPPRCDRRFCARPRTNTSAKTSRAPSATAIRRGLTGLRLEQVRSL